MRERERVILLIELLAKVFSLFVTARKFFTTNVPNIFPRATVTKSDRQSSSNVYVKIFSITNI